MTGVFPPNPDTFTELWVIDVHHAGLLIDLHNKPKRPVASIRVFNPRTGAGRRIDKLIVEYQFKP
jgi:hypothetical protein